jgi:hypothetical protein
MRKQLLALLPILFLTVGLKASAQTLPAAQIRSMRDLPQVELLDNAAQAGADHFRRLLTDKNAPGLGFSSAWEGSSSQLGMPIRHYFVRLDSLKNYSGKDPKALLENYSTVTYPLMSGGEAKSGVGLVLKNSQWQVVSLGESSMVKRWHGLRRQHSQSYGVDESEFFTVRVSALNVELMGYYNGQSQMILIPEVDDKRWGIKQGEAQPADQLFLKLVPKALEQNDKGAS